MMARNQSSSLNAFRETHATPSVAQPSSSSRFSHLATHSRCLRAMGCRSFRRDHGSSACQQRDRLCQVSSRPELLPDRDWAGAPTIGISGFARRADRCAERSRDCRTNLLHGRLGGTPRAFAPGMAATHARWSRASGRRSPWRMVVHVVFAPGIPRAHAP